MRKVRVQVLKLGLSASGRISVIMPGKKTFRFKVKPFSFEGLSLGLQEHCGLEPRDAAHVVRQLENEIIL